MKLKMILKERKRANRMNERSAIEWVTCNLCQKTFRASLKYQRFCKICKLDEELFRFSDWLPALGAC